MAEFSSSSQKILYVLFSLAVVSVSSDSVPLQSFLEKSVTRISNSMEVVNGFIRHSNHSKDQVYLRNCFELMEYSIDRLNDSVEALKINTPSNLDDAHTWLSAVLTNHVTCLDGLSEASGLGESIRTPMGMEVNDLIANAEASLNMITEISASSSSNQETTSSRRTSKTFPSWVTMRDKKHLETLPNDVVPNLVVAKEGNSRYKTVHEAVNAAPDNSKTRYVIYIKKGVYKENVVIGKTKKNLMIVGDGMGATIITGSLNYHDGTDIDHSATVDVLGDGFIAKDICFRNTAGPNGLQAVAIRVAADKAAFSRCRFDAYQDTLYAHSCRQFYRDCSIMGTVDIIFGDASVVIQNSEIMAKLPLGNQYNMLTAQGRTFFNSSTGISIQNCRLTASSDLKLVQSSLKTFLGRPWKRFSRTVFMYSFLEDHIDPAGWWTSRPFTETLYFGEFNNDGPRKDTTNRVKWPGFHNITDPAEAQQFTVAKFIQGGDWLKSTGVAYKEGL